VLTGLHFYFKNLMFKAKEKCQHFIKNRNFEKIPFGYNNSFIILCDKEIDYLVISS
jgi:hypothetical protein